MLFRGLPSGADEGAFMLFLIFPFLAMIAAFMSSFLAVRHTRMDEELGRAELVAATPAGRTLPLVATRVPRHPRQSRARAADLPRPPGHGARGTRGRFVAGFGAGAVGVSFLGVGLLSGQLMRTSRGANSLAVWVLLLTFLIGGLGNALGTPDRRSAAHRELLADLALAIRVGRELPAVRRRQRVAAVAVRRVRTGAGRSLASRCRPRETWARASCPNAAGGRMRPRPSADPPRSSGA